MPRSARVEIPCEAFDFELSSWDMRFPPVHSRRVLCFKTSQPESQMLDALETAFKATVKQLPFLAGSIVPFSESKDTYPGLRTIKAEGSAFLFSHDLRDKLSYEELKRRDFPEALLDHGSLCPFDKMLHTESPGVPVCGMQANLVSGGLLLAVSVINVVGDGKGISNVIEAFAKNMARASSDGASLSSVTPFVEDRRKLVSGEGLTGDIDKHPAWTTSATDAHVALGEIKTRRSNVKFFADSLVRLKEAAKPQHGAGWISTHDAIAALTWRTLMLGRCKAGIIPEDAPVSLTTAVDCRKHLNLPDPYYGVAIYAIHVRLPLSVLASETGLSVAASLIRKDINSVTGDTFRDLLAFTERTGKEQQTRLTVLPELANTGILFTSHWKFAMEGLDFGPLVGKVQAFRHANAHLLPGTPVILPRSKDGSAVLTLNEREDVVKYMLEDELFKQYAVDGES